MLIKSNKLIAKSLNGSEILVSIVPLKKIQNTCQGFKWVEVGKRVLLQSGVEIDLNLDGRSFYTDINQMYRLANRVN